MSKVLKFNVEVSQVGMSKTKSVDCLAKNLDRLLSTMPKPIRKKWKSISWTDEYGNPKVLNRDEFEQK